MSTAIIGSKGPITLPAAVRAALEVEQGTRVEFIEIEPGCYELIAATGSVRQLKGMFGKARKRVSIQEMNPGYRRHAARAR